jgi:hypothetical protein
MVEVRSQEGLVLLTLLITLARHIGAWWCAITSQESVCHYHRVAQTPALGEAPLEPSLEPSPSRAITPFQFNKREVAHSSPSLCVFLCSVSDSAHCMC